MRDFLNRHRSVLLFLLLGLCALLLYSNNLRQKNQTTLFEKAVLQLASPLHNGINGVARVTQQTWQNYLALVNVRQDNIELTQELQDLRRQLVACREIAQENTRLKQLLDFRQSIQLKALPARIIAVDAMSWFRTVTLDKGTDDGVRENLPVVTAQGVVGRTIKCAPRSSRVLLMTDASSAAAAIIQSSRSRGIVRGQGAALVFDYAARLDDIIVGDQVVTAGTGGVFPKGLPIGQISHINKLEYGLFQEVELAPAVDFSRLEDVLILLRSEQ
ncbi:MAG: rod shape-determining protein MreC [Desulfuromonadaceae bacterium]|nr:rod shape-determining protein MreC [Desulfuromonadaceae bacterium]